MTPEQIAELKKTVGEQAAAEIKKTSDAAEQRINQAMEDKTKGLMTDKAFSEFKENELKTVNDALQKLEDAMKEQGNKINAVLERQAPASKSFEEFITELAPQIKEAKNNGKMIEITSTQLKAAGVTSIGGSVQNMDTPPNSPYAPGIGGGDLEIFDIARDPNFILNQVDMGRTGMSRLAWANETDYQGAPEEVTEGNDKPLTQHKFKVEMSEAKKIAGYIKLTDEFDQDLPNFATRVRRMLQEDVIRGWDTAVQTAVIAAARDFNINTLNDSTPFANYWDALMAMLTQVRKYNFNPNTIGVSPEVDMILATRKTTTGEYLTPAFAPTIDRMKVIANKLGVGNALVGDLKQYKVDVYKEFVLKVGLVNDDLIKNQFSIVGEIRYHRYISDARKNAICHDNLNDVVTAISQASSSI
jgi:hypothetical protein